LVSNNLFFQGLFAQLANDGNNPKLYAPNLWDKDSSISHLDETTYNGTLNSLMTPKRDAGEAGIHDPGPISLGILQDLGWTISLSQLINNVTAIEGNRGTKDAVFTVRLSKASDQTVTVEYTTVDGTATNGSDYKTTSGTLTFNPGETEQTITVEVIGDSTPENDETFFVKLSNPSSNATIALNEGVGTIKNNDSDFAFAPSIISTEDNDVSSVFAADVDKDGDIDVLSGSLNGELVWYKNENTAGNESQWTSHIISQTGNISSVFAADVDKDGDIDVLSGSSNGKLVWYKNENTAGNESQWTSHIISQTQDSSSIFAVDVDKDGDIDVLSGSSNGELVWYKNENTAGNESQWTSHIIPSQTQDSSSVFAADVDKDGDIDVLSGSLLDTKLVWYENTAGNESQWTSHIISQTGNSSSVFAADVDKDGDIDILSGSSSIVWYENTAEKGTQWTSHIISQTGNSSSVFAADVDKDGDIDVFSGSLNGKLVWYENTVGKGTQWTSHIISQTGNSSSVFAADVDKDGDIDVLSGSYNNKTTAWYENQLIPPKINGGFIDQLIDGLRKIWDNIGDLFDELIDGIGSYFPQLQGGVDDQVYANKLPLLGDLNSLSSSDTSDLISSLRASSSSSSLAPLKFITEIRDAILDKLAEVVAETLDPLREILSDTLGDVLNVPEITNDQFKDFLGELLNELLSTQFEPNEEGLIDAVGQALSSTFNINAQSIDDKIEDFLRELNAELTEQLNGILSQPLGPIRQAFLDAVGPDGINILKDSNGDGTVDIKDVGVDVTNLSGVKFDLNLGTEKTFSTSLATDIGLPGLGLKVDGDAQVDFDFDLNLGFGVNKTDGFFLDTSKDKELSINLNASLPGLEATGELGFLQLDVTDKDSSLKAGFSVNLKDQNSDGKLTASELTSVKLDTKLDVAADVNLGLVTSFDGEAKLPSISTDFNLDWSFQNAKADPTKTLGGDNKPIMASTMSS
jgi:hypothetical protein